mgnify:CR=1 FL=1
MPTKTSVYCIIVSYNGEKFLPELFASLDKTIIPNGVEFKTVVVDNASTDDSLSYLKTLNNIHLIESKTNTGFAEGNNIGLRYALENGADFVFLLNQDTMVDVSWLQEIMETAKKHPEAGAIQSLLLLHNPDKTAPKLINSWGNELHFLGFGFAGGLKKLFKPDTLSTKSITYASGAAVLFRAEDLKKIGLFDASYFLYNEDTDLSLRLRISGHNIVLAPKSIIYHKYKFGQNYNTYYYLEKNRLRILLEYYKWPTLLLILPFFIGYELGILLFALKNGFFKAKIKSWWWVIKNFSLIMKKRQAIQKLRTVSDLEFTKILRGDIEFVEINNPLLQYIANPLGQIYWTIIRNLIFW